MMATHLVVAIGGVVIGLMIQACSASTARDPNLDALGARAAETRTPNGRRVDQGRAGSTQAPLRAEHAQVFASRIRRAATPHRSAQPVVAPHEQVGPTMLTQPRVNHKAQRGVSLSANPASFYISVARGRYASWTRRNYLGPLISEPFIVELVA
jgi:hypothetical protein